MTTDLIDLNLERAAEELYWAKTIAHRNSYNPFPHDHDEIEECRHEAGMHIACANALIETRTQIGLLDEVEAAHASRREAQARVAELTEQVQKMRAHLHRITAAAMNDPSNRWYVIDKRGVATLCLNWEDARDTAREADQAYPDNAPHVFGLMSVADMEGGEV